MGVGAKVGTTRSAWAKLAIATCILALAISALASAASAATLTDADELGRFGSEGSGAGQFAFLGPVAADPVTGHVYVGDGGNNRIDEFTPWGGFVKAFGWDVAPGAVNEQQEVRVRSGAGSFNLTFGANTTADLPFDASAAEVQSALSGLASIGGAGGSIAVTALPGKVATATPYVYVVAFKGSLAGKDVAQLTAENGATPLSAGNPKTELEVRTRADGTPGGTGLESCTEESGCQEGSRGEGAGQFVSLQVASEAVDAAGNLYVGERSTERVQKFSPAGNFVWMIGGEVDKTTGANLCTAASGDECGTGVTGTNPGQFDAGNFGVTVVIAPDGGVLVASTNWIQRFNAAGEYQSRIEVPGTENGIPSFAVDPKSGAFYITFQGEKNVHKLDPTTGKELGSLKVERPSDTTTDSAGDVFVAAREVSNGDEESTPETNKHKGPFARVIEFDPAGSRVSVFAESEQSSNSGANDHFFIGGLGTNTLGDLYVTNHESSLHSGAFIRFFGPAPISLETPPLRPPQIAAQYAAAVGGGEAELRAKINPRFWNDTTYHLEYGTSPCAAGGCTNTAEARLSSKVSGSALRSPGVLLEGLEAGTTYHYRFVAKSSGGGPVYGVDPDGEGPEEADPEDGLEGTFITPRTAGKPSCPGNEAFRSGSSASLPDCRAYEMVSPVDKEGGDIAVLPTEGALVPARLDQSATDGERFTYGSYRSFGGAESAPWTSQYVAARREGKGWVSHPISPPRGEVIVGIVQQSNPEFQAFSPDLCQSWFKSFGEPPLAPGAPAENIDLYRRTDDECGGPSLEALNTTEAPSEELRLNLQGVSGDGATAIFFANKPLAEGGTAVPGEGLQQLYGFQDGEERFLCVLPSGHPLAGTCTAGWSPASSFNGQRDRVASALSADGRRVYWTASGQALGGLGPIFLRENLMAPQSSLKLGGAGGTGTLKEGSTAVTPLVAARGKASIESGSPIATLIEVPSVGEFLAGQPLNTVTGIEAGTKVVSCSPECGPNAKTLTLNKNATATKESVTLTSKGPMPFAVGQTITAPGIPAGTTIAAVKENELTLSKAATGKGNVPLEASSECTEAARACTLAVSAAAEAEAGSGGSEFWAAAEDGSRAIFTVGSASLGGALYEYRLADRSTHPIAGKVLGLLGASADASRVYLVSEEALGGTNPQGKAAIEGKQNIYLYEGGQLRFIGLLEGRGDLSSISSTPIFQTARVSADGLHAAFMSTASLTGYDNADVDTEEAAAEVFLYDVAGNEGEGSLACASCNPSGARPAAEEPKNGGRSTRSLVAAQIPGYENGNLYAPRALSEGGGRLFFDSYDALVPRDTNGRQDVYEWEAPGSGSCEEESPSYSPLTGGCVDLLSSGKSPLDSEFIDASPSGDDLFFATASSLLPSDYGLQDIYDARVGGGLPPPPAPPVQCEGEACQSPPEAPNDPTPASSSFEGAGNVEEKAAPTPASSRCAKGKVKRHGKCVTKRHQAKKHKRAKRQGRAAR